MSPSGWLWGARSGPSLTRLGPLIGLVSSSSLWSKQTKPGATLFLATGRGKAERRPDQGALGHCALILRLRRHLLSVPLNVEVSGRTAGHAACLPGAELTLDGVGNRHRGQSCWWRHWSRTRGWGGRGGTPHRAGAAASRDRRMCRGERAGEVSDGHAFLRGKGGRARCQAEESGVISRQRVSHASSPLGSLCTTGSPGCWTRCQPTQLASGKVPDFLRGPHEVGAGSLGPNGHLLLA